ncbi:hypothetical protein D3C71_1099560 [compost metagenome]
MNFTEQQILQLAPDEASIKAGKNLSAASHWLVAAVNDRVLWGEIKGSGSKPYFTQIDLQNIAFKCSCPSRKFPCKHGLGLMLLSYTSPPAILSGKEEPAWVADWMDKRVAKSVKSEPDQGTEQVVDEKGREKRETDRLKSVEAGINELDLVLNDLVRHGLMHLNGLTNDFFSNLAKRMVDAKATGLANRIEGLNELKYSISQKETQHRFVQQLAELNFIVRSFQNREQLDELTLESLKVSMGWNQSSKSLVEDRRFETVKDHWLIAGQQLRERENMKIQTTYLVGKSTGKKAQLLQFSINNQPMEWMLPIEAELEAGLVFFPHLIPFRAAIRVQNGTNACDVSAYSGLQNFETALGEHASNLQRFPLHFETVVVVEGVKIGQVENRFVAIDSEQHYLRLDEEAFSVSKQIDWLAKTEGKACKTILILRFNRVIPLGIFVSSNYYCL